MKWDVERADLSQVADFKRFRAGTPPHERATFDRVGVDDDHDLRAWMFFQQSERLLRCIGWIPDFFVLDLTPTLLSLRLRVERNF
jgi:hypothetical protein